MTDVYPALPSPPRQVFSERLDGFLSQIQEGATPNFGAFCSFCYNPLPQGFERCDHCGLATDDNPPITSIPDDVLDMHRRKLKRESVVVNAFAYVGLALGLAIFLAMVAINVLYLDKALWFFILATFIFLVGSRVLAGVIGGVIGDEVGYRYANKRLAEDWAAHVAARQSGAGTDNQP
jgi:rRNA maturation protein Nop10